MALQEAAAKRRPIRRAKAVSAAAEITSLRTELAEAQAAREQTIKN